MDDFLETITQISYSGWTMDRWWSFHKLGYWSKLTTLFFLADFNFIDASSDYTGDVRMGVGENPNKASNIVEGQKEALTALYTPILVKMKGIDVNDDLITVEGGGTVTGLSLDFPKKVGHDLSR